MGGRDGLARRRGADASKRGQMIGTAMGAAIAGALLGPVIGVAADLTGFELVFCTVGAVGVGLMIWTLRDARREAARRRLAARA